MGWGMEGSRPGPWTLPIRPSTLPLPTAQKGRTLTPQGMAEPQESSLTRNIHAGMLREQKINMCLATTVLMMLAITAILLWLISNFLLVSRKERQRTQGAFVEFWWLEIFFLSNSTSPFPSEKFHHALWVQCGGMLPRGGYVTQASQWVASFESKL